MILGLVLVLGALQPHSVIGEARLALDAGRPEQAREMIARTVASGASGAQVDRLLADLAFVEHRWPEALVRYNALIAVWPSPDLYERAGIAALQNGQASDATALLMMAVKAPGASWSSWNALGVAADRRADWATADNAYAAALKVNPAQAAIWNNLGWSRMLQGHWSQAVEPLTRAHALSSKEPRIAANLDLARSAVEGQLPSRRAGENGAAFAARLNDAGVMARLNGDQTRAAAAFAQALEASDRWFAPAAANLAALNQAAIPLSAEPAVPSSER